jgi:hypothetical protein
MNTGSPVIGATESTGHALHDDLEQAGFASRLCGRARLELGSSFSSRDEPQCAAPLKLAHETRTVKA